MKNPTFPSITDDKMKQLLALPSGLVRLVIDTDTHNEIDDQFALAWALLSQDSFKIEGVYAAPYSFRHLREPLLKAYAGLKTSQALRAVQPPPVLADNRMGTEWAQQLSDRGIDPYKVSFVNPDEGMELSYQEILCVFDKMDEDPAGKVFRGSEGYLTSLEKPIRSPAAEHLIEHALNGGERPLYVAAIGCLSNVASAILLEPKIIEHIVVLWTSAYPSNVNLSNEPSLNLVQDKLASQLIFNCGVPHVYLPGYHVGAQLSISLPEMKTSVRGKGKIGDYLYHLYTHNPVQAMRGIDDLEERTWIIWDLINFAWLLNSNWVPSQLVRSPILTDALFWKHSADRHLMREAYDINRDAIFRDFFQKLEKAPK